MTTWLIASSVDILDSGYGKNFRLLFKVIETPAGGDQTWPNEIGFPLNFSAILRATQTDSSNGGQIMWMGIVSESKEPGNFGA